MRWYQHRVHGMKRACSEKYRLPAVAAAATRNANHSATSSTAATTAATDLDERATSRATARPMAPAPASRARRLVNTCTASTSTARSMADGSAAGRAGRADIVPRRMASVVAQMRRTRRLRRLGSLEWFEIAYRVYLAALLGGGVVLWLSGLVSDDPAT